MERLSNAGKLISWVKNDHLGFKIWYVFKGEIKTYYPDFILKISEDNFLIIETKGLKKDQDEFKWNALSEWCLAINNSKRFGHWEFKKLLKQEDFKNLL